MCWDGAMSHPEWGTWHHAERDVAAQDIPLSLHTQGREAEPHGSAAPSGLLNGVLSAAAHPQLLTLG